MKLEINFVHKLYKELVIITNCNSYPKCSQSLSEDDVILGLESCSVEKYATKCLQWKYYDNHSSGNEIYFPIGSISASITGIGFPTLLTHYDIVAFYSIICLVLGSVTSSKKNLIRKQQSNFKDSTYL